MEIAFFRLAQEALTNVRNHAQARRMRIELRRWEQEVRLEARDFGRGFDPTARPLESGPGKRVGFAGMWERASTLGGGLSRSTAVASQVPRWWR